MSTSLAVITTGHGALVPHEQLQESPNPTLGRVMRFNGRGKTSFYKYKAEDGSEHKIQIGAKFVANIDEIKRGFVLWGSQEGTNRPLSHIIGNMLDPALRLPIRAELGFLDKSQWPVGLSGKPEDPVHDSRWLYMKEPGHDYLLTFTTDSWGGKEAVRTLVERYKKLLASHPNYTKSHHPVVALEQDVKESLKFGEISRPKFVFTGEWESKELFAEAMANAVNLDDDMDTVGQDITADGEVLDQAPAQKDALDHVIEAAGGSATVGYTETVVTMEHNKSKNKKSKVTTREDLDDEIPF